MGAWLPYRCAWRFLSELFPLGNDPPWHETVRRRTMRVGAGLERESLSRAKTPQAVPPSETMTVSIDAGHVRTARGHPGRTFKVMAAQVSNDDVQPVLFSGVPGEADQQYTQLNGVLSGLGMTGDTEVTILSDDADGPRSLGEAASIGTVFYLLDWFHLAMRVQHVAQCASGWPNATVRARRDGARFADAVKHIRWRLWHGQTERALRLIQRTLAGVEAKRTGKTAAARPATKLTKVLIALETYVSGLADLILITRWRGWTTSRSPRRQRRAPCSGCCIAGWGRTVAVTAQPRGLLVDGDVVASAQQPSRRKPGDASADHGNLEPASLALPHACLTSGLSSHGRQHYLRTKGPTGSLVGM